MTYKVVLTTSDSLALDIATLLCDVQPGDVAILLLFTFSFTADAFALRGANARFR